MKVSILMGIYNCADTLDAAIKSILDQTYQDWELILCDDGSSDNTYDVAARYQKLQPKKIVLLKNDKNYGLNITLNNCLRQAKGDYIARMDGDDISLPTRLEKEVSFLNDHPEYAIVSTPMIYFDENGDWANGSDKNIPELKDIVKGTPHCHAPCMVRKEAYDAVDGYSVDKKLLRMEDYHLWIKMYAQGYRGYNLNECLYKMRDDRKATSRRTYRTRINEAYVKLLAIHMLKLPIWNFVFVLRPLIVGLLPIPIYEYFHRKLLYIKKG